MGRRRAGLLVGSLSLAAGAALAWLPAASAGAAPARPAARQHAVCAPVARGYARCLAHVVNAATSAGHRPGPTGTTPRGYSPAVITGAYGFSTAGGAGETIAIVDAYGAPTLTSNLQTFSTEYGLGPCTHSNGCFTKVNQSGGTSYPKSTSGWALEQSLDAEWAHSMAPKAHILLVEASTSSFTNLLSAVSYASAHANYVSMSWGGTEFSSETSDDSSFTKSGVSYFAAAGDTGSSVIYPSASPDVISVGGTTLTVTGTTWKSETAWATAGGGCSRYESANPAQSAYKTYPNVTCGGKRATPDISLDANPTTGVSVYDTERLSTGQSGWLQVGGTSASTVMVAAHAAETASVVNAAGLYSGTLKVYDVTSGSNGHPCTVGYDLCTGLGSWNTAVGTQGGTSSGGTSGTLSFTPGAGQTLTAGTASSPIAVALSPAAPSGGLTISLATTTGGFSTSATATSYSPTLTLHLTAQATKSGDVYYESTKAGSHTITASAPGWTSASQTETVSAAALSRIAVSPGSATLAEGATQVFSATGFDQYTNPVTLTDPSWSLTSPALGNLTPTSGPTTTLTAGSSATSGTLSATTSGVRGSASVTVRAAATLAAAIAAGTSSKHGPWWHTPLTVSVTQGGTPVSGATVSLTVYGGASCSTVEATGTGTTGTGGTASFTFKTRSTGTYCAVASVRDGGQSASATTSFSIT